VTDELSGKICPTDRVEGGRIVRREKADLLNPAT